MSEKLEFKVSSALKNIVGRDLIENDNVAVFELVKNSYDARARNVIINIKSDSIIISDNGKGMDLNDIRDKWLFLAYSAKKDDSEDEDIDDLFRDIVKDRQHFAGAKGVGRFSADRLGRYLKMTTKTVKASNCEVISIDWSLFDVNQNATFTSIDVEHSKAEFGFQFPLLKNHGTIIEISGLHKLWTRDELITLRRFLEKLINPFGDLNNFSIEIECEREALSDSREKEDNKKVNGLVKNTVIEVLSLRTTRLDQYTEGEYIYTQIYDRGTLMYKIREINQYDLLDDFNVSILFLNTSAKNIFTRRMGIRSVEYGSLFLYKNGVRVLPYGENGDDSWELDRRKQQGHSRYLGTRDILGQISIVTNNHEQFKETSSRDGGLINTAGAKEIKNLFKDTSRKLERYVVGVLWGGNFLQEGYFNDENYVGLFRKELKSDQDNYESNQVALSNVGSRVDYTQIIKGLVQDESIEILDFNKEMTQFLAEELNVVKLDILKDLNEIALKTNDKVLKSEVTKLTTEILKEKQKREEAENREEVERKRRIEAEKRAELEKQKREEAERKQREEAEKRKNAELDLERKEKERALAQVAKLKAEMRAKEEEELRQLAEQKAKEEEEKGKLITEKLNIETQKNQYLNATRKTLSDDAEQLIHSIDLYVGNAATYVNDLLSSNIDIETKNKIYSIKNNIDKAIKVSQIIIKSNFDYKHTKQRINLPIYIKEYFEDIALSRPKLSFKIDGVFDKFYLINPIEIDIILDNLVSNSYKAKAKNILVNLDRIENKTIIRYYDDGIGMDSKLVRNPNSIFELGVRESNERGSGIGMFDVKNRLKNLKGTITFIGNSTKLRGAGFEIII
ncbi:ATP-binding protein [Myroides guanonis]|uniref:Histidine kinase-, DNA gyrase B-, and HSP90-like ATPase n=1 Tax=Myroides guanonis TaxID=1150112 RepID=A0A1I3PNC4_9FLAO|nr:ATP-binding protein [Myroides guanonis]SFJ22801.1 Histidine kinase-, DNA gyrase B-, and HSP90-like ATPase [Myroides guanonis]